MTRPHLIAKLILAAVGVNLLMHSLNGIGSAVVMLSQKDLLPEAFPIRMSITVAKSIITFALSLILLFWSDGLVRIIAGPDADECAKVNIQWIIAGLRMTACFYALLILYHRIDLIFYYIPAFINGTGIFSYMTLERQSSRISSTKALVIILAEITVWIIGIYLIFGAASLCAWQMRAVTIKQQPQNSGVDKNEQE